MAAVAQPCAPTSPSTPSRWACGRPPAQATTPTAWSTTATRESHYLAIRYTQRLAEAGVVASVGSTGDSYDNAMAEAFNSLFKTELVRNRGTWKTIDDFEIAVAEYIDWFNHRRLHGEIGLVPPVEFEHQHYAHDSGTAHAEPALETLH